MVKGILFDFDMTLIDTSPALLDNINRIAAHFGLPQCTMPRLMEKIGLNSHDFWVEILGDKKPEYMEYYRNECMPNEAALMVPTPGAFECLERLRSVGVKVGCASNRVHPMRVVRAKEFEHLMDCVVGAEHVAEPKPAPDVLLKGAELLGCGIDETIYVGDTEFDIEAARRAEMRSVVVVTSNPRERLEAARPWRIIDDLRALVPLLEDEGELPISRV